MPGSEQSISVVMPVHNAMPHLDEAVRSILDQTHSQFEFVILDDGSSDGSTERLRDWAAKDDRIRLVEGGRNLGPVGSSNRVVELASHDLIARMDADDVSLPTRLEEQFRVLQEQRDIGMVACACDVIGAEGQTVRGSDLWRLTRKSWFVPFAHGSVLFRRELFRKAGGYRDECAFWEDQDLFVRMLALPGVRIAALPRTLYRVRYSSVSTRVASDQERVERAVDLMYRSVDRLSAGRLYDDLLRSSDANGIDPRVFIATGSLALWANGRPKLFRRLLAKGHLTPDFRTISALAWTAWASLNPASLRLFLKFLLNMRNAFAPAVHEQIIDWHPPRLNDVRNG